MMIWFKLYNNGGGRASRVMIDEWILNLGDGSILYSLDGAFGVPLLLKFIVIDCCSRCDDDDDNVRLPYCTKSDCW
jgi:hypothetical protein